MTDAIQQTLNAAGPDGVVLFSKSHWGNRAKNNLKSIGRISFVVVELDQHPDGPQMQAALREMTGQRTIPFVWLGGKHIGGSEDVARGVASGLFNDSIRHPQET